MENNKIQSPEESLQIIQNMMNEAQKEVSENGQLYLLWGWSVFLSAILHFILLQLNISLAFIVWPIAMPLTAIIAMVFIKREHKKQRIRTLFTRLMPYLWGSIGIAILIVLFASPKIGFDVSYPFLIILYAIGTAVSGAALSFKPLLIGALLCFFCAIGAFLVEFQFQLLFLALSILVAYIIPGHLLSSKNKKA